MVAAFRSRRGASAIGCMASVVLVMIVLYYGVNLGRVWWRYFEIKDRMHTAARYSVNQTDAQVQAQLRADAQEIGLPEEGHRFRIVRTRTPPSIVISTEYRESVELPLVHRTLRFKPEVTLRR